jgi:hypothetical protein
MVRNTLLDIKGIREVLRDMPHGSGLDFNYTVLETKSFVRIVSTFDTMDENGYYDYTVTFTVLIHKSDKNRDRITFLSSDLSQYYGRKYDLCDHLWEMFSDTIEGIHACIKERKAQ